MLMALYRNWIARRRFIRAIKANPEIAAEMAALFTESNEKLKKLGY